MKNAAPPVGLKPTTFVALSFAHRSIHLRHGGWRTWQKLAVFYCYVVNELLALCYCLCWFWLVVVLVGNGMRIGNPCQILSLNLLLGNRSEC